MYQQSSSTRKRNGRLLLILPIIALPFLALGFWALGGGHGLKTAATAPQTGINTALPDAHLPNDSAMDKMSFYEQEEKLAADKDELMPQDSSIPEESFMQMPENPYQNPYDYSRSGSYPSPGVNQAENSERKIQQQLAALQASLNKEPSTEMESTPGNGNRYGQDDTTNLAKMQQLMNAYSTEEKPDPEMTQLQAVMDRIYDIQHPEEIAARVQETSEKNRGIVYPVQQLRETNIVHVLHTGVTDSTAKQILSQNRAGFYGLNIAATTASNTDKGITAVVQENTTIVNGASIKLRLLEPISINGTFIPAGTFVTGRAQLTNDRIGIEVSSILYQSSLFGVKLSTYDMDGMPGLYVPGSISRDVEKDGGNNLVQGVGTTTVDPSLGAQAAAAGIETAKTLFSKKVKLVRVYIKAGHHLLLKNNQP
jgi:conjugative transposon TraM protein